MKVLDLFSGIGGFSLGLESVGMETVAFCEKEQFCQQVLKKHWPAIPIHDDIKILDGRQYHGTIDVLTGGYPCQGESRTGKRMGKKDNRWLWPEMRRIIRESKPRWVIAENVGGHVSLGFDEVSAQMESDGFTVWPFIIPASAFNARHQRDRVWIMAHAQCNGIQGGASFSKAQKEKSREEQLARFLQPCAWPSLSSARTCGITYGVSGRVDTVKRNKAIGNSVHPGIIAAIGQSIINYERSLLQ